MTTQQDTTGRNIQWGIGAKIIAGYLAMLVILIGVAALLLVNLQILSTDLNDIVNHDMVVIERAKELEKLVIDLETGERGYLITGQEEFLEPYNAADNSIDTVYSELRTLLAENPAQVAALDGIKASIETWQTDVAEPFIEARRDIGSTQIRGEGEIAGMNALIRNVGAGTGKNIMDSIRTDFAEFIATEQAISALAAENAQNNVNTLQILVIGVTGLGLALGLGAGVYLGRNISGNIREVMTAAQEVAGGNLERRVTVNSGDEVQRLAEAFNIMADNLQAMMASQVAKDYIEDVITRYREFVNNIARGDLTTNLQLEKSDADKQEDLYQMGLNLNEMVGSLRDMTEQINEIASGVSASSAEILAATTQQIASATEQEAAVTQTMTTVEEVRTTVRQTADRAQSVAEASRQSVEVSQDGETSVTDSIAGMRLIQQRVESIAENILMLSERTQQIGEIIETVNEIAAQSKLLALNASIEAARAGEEGKGFAVVAMEVRQLAEQSREATERVRDILNQIQQATNTAVMVTEEGSKGAESGMLLVERAGDSIRDLSRTIEESAQAATQIAASTNQQNNGMDQLAQAMSSIKQASTQTAASTRQAENSARDLNDMAQRMQTAVARYQLN